MASVLDGLARRAQPYGGPRGSLEQDPNALTEALDTLRLQHEELLVANEELRAQIDEMRQLEASAAFANERADALFVSAPEAQIITDRKGVVREANHAAADLLSLRSRYLVGKPLLALVDRFDFETFRQVTNDAVHGNVVEAQLRLRPRGALAGVRVDALVSPFAEGDRIVWRFRVVREERDIAPTIDGAADRAALRDEETASRAKDRMIALVSHDLRGPLNAIGGWIDVLRSAPDDAELREKAFGTIERAARQQARLVDDLLDITRLAAGKLRIRESSVDLASLVRSEVDAVRPAAKSREIELCLAEDATLSLPVAGDASRLQQVLANLLGNALKFTPRRGAVFVELAEENGRAIFAVRDTGRGIAPSAIDRIFDAFRQEDGSSTHDGLGLGLFISRQIAELHRGSLTCASPGEGKGSTFTLALPLRDLSAAPPLSAPRLVVAPRPARVLEGLRILVVEDDTDSRELAGIIIRTSGGHATLASSVAAAIETLDVFRPDVIVSDIRMPGEDDGNRFVQALRTSRHASVPAIAMSGNAAEGELQRAMESGFDAYLVKPVTMDALVSAIAEAAEMGRAVRASSPPPTEP